MNKTIKEKWIANIEAFLEKPSYLRLIFPMKICSSQGEMFSPLGLLCQLHVDETKSNWDVIKDIQEDESLEEEEKPKKTKKKFDNTNRLDTITGYKGSNLIPPEEVLKWAGIDTTFCSKISRLSDEEGFNGVIKFLKENL